VPYQKNAEYMTALTHMLENFPRQPVVIDHCLNFKAGRRLDAILADVPRLAKYTNAHAKLTFLATGSVENYPFRDMHEPCRKIISAYTPDALCLGQRLPLRARYGKLSHFHGVT